MSGGADGDDKRKRRPRRVAILFSQFAPYHVDRCVAAAERLGERAEVVAVEVATASADYAWPPSGEVGGARKVVLFPGRKYDEIPRWRRFLRQLAVLRRCDDAFFGIGADQPDVAALGFVLPLFGVRVFAMTESKFDDKPRRLGRELLKAALLLPYRGALVGGARQADYMRFLGFRRRPVVTGYDAVGLARVCAQADLPAAPDGAPFTERPFVFVGRFVAKKNIAFLLRAYARYRELAGPRSRALRLVGGGDLEGEVRAEIDRLGLGEAVTITGFVEAPAVAAELARALALVIPSTEEQWGLVVNEALAFSLPVLASEAVGARDALVVNLVNGFVLAPGNAEAWALGMAALAGDEALWRRMVAASGEVARRGDAARFGEGVERLLFNLKA